MDLVAAFRVFVCVAERGGFSPAARELGVGQPAVSKQMASLEAHLGTRLFNRSSLAFSLSDDGLALLERARAALEAMDDAQDLVRLRRQQVSGSLRIAGPVVFGQTRLIPCLVQLVRRYPGLELDILLSDHFVDLAEERVDLALRVGEITDGSLIARPLAAVRRVALASPDYLERKGMPQHPDDLQHHDCVIYTRLATGARWHFDSSTGPIEVKVSGPVRVNNSAGVLAAVLSGAGIGVVPMFTLTDQIERGQLRVILERFEPLPLPMNLVYASRRHMSAKLRLLVDFLVEQFSDSPVANN